jgi:hypothetical protein
MKTIKKTDNAVSFQVSDVEQATDKLATAKPNAYLAGRIGRPVEACSTYTTNLVRDVTVNPLLAAAKLAFDQHRPLCLSPDMIWLTVLQGVAEHLYAKSITLMVDNSASAIKRHSLNVSTETLPIGSPESDWAVIIADAANQARQIIDSELAELFSVTFSTTTSLERSAFDLTLLAGLDRYLTMFDALAICGFPSITLEGTVDDWKQLQAAVALTQQCCMPAWTQSLRKIASHFVSAAEGKPSLGYWEQMVYRKRDGICHASDIISGWIGDLFPYGARFGSVSQKRQLRGQDQTDIVDFPNGLGRVSMLTQRSSRIDIHAGLIGVEQLEDLTLRPKIGWTVQRQSTVERLIEEVAAHPRCRWNVAPHGDKPKMLSRPVTLRDLFSGDIIDIVSSRQLQQFYDVFLDLEILADDGSLRFRLRSSDEISWQEDDKRRSVLASIADLPDGRIIGLTYVRDDATKQPLPGFFLCQENDAFEWRPCLLISNSFSEVIRWAIEAGDGLLDTAPSFTPLATITPTDKELLRVLKPLGRVD